MDIVDQIKKKIQEALTPSVIEVLDESSMHGSRRSSHLRVLVVSSEFEGLSSLKRQRKVFQAVGPSLLSQIHAFSQAAYTPREWEEGRRSAGVSPPCHHKKRG